MIRRALRVPRDRSALWKAALAAVVTLSTAVTAQAATLIYSNDVLGELEDCGCRGVPRGGVLRKSVYLDSLADKDLLQLDAGDLLFDTDLVPPLLAKKAELRATTMLRALELLGHNAIVPGEKEFALGFLAFERLRQGTWIRFLAANLKKKDGSRFLDAHAEFTVGKLKVAVIGLVGSDLRWPVELVAGPVIPVAKQEVQALREKADLIIALTHQGYEADRMLAEAVPGIDIIVGSHTQSFLQTPIQVGKTHIFQSSYRGQHLGILPLQKPLLTEGHQLVDLNPAYDPKPGASDRSRQIEKLLKKFKREEKSN